jgi:hypothetical protein
MVYLPHVILWIYKNWPALASGHCSQGSWVRGGCRIISQKLHTVKNATTMQFQQLDVSSTIWTDRNSMRQRNINARQYFRHSLATNFTCSFHLYFEFRYHIRASAHNLDLTFRSCVIINPIDQRMRKCSKNPNTLHAYTTRLLFNYLWTSRQVDDETKSKNKQKTR